MYSSGLVLEGGGSRGIYTSGVLDAFMENDITFPYVIGVSAGSCHGASFLGKCIHRQHDVLINSVQSKKYMGIGNLLKYGEFLGSKWIFNELSYDMYPLDQDVFENSGSVLCCVVTNAATGKAEYMYPKTLRPRGCPEIRASCSMPIVTKGVEIGGQLYYDGGLVDSIPLERAFDDGCEKCVCVLTQHRGYRKTPIKPKFTKVMKKYPNVAKAMANRHIMYNEQLDFVHDMEEKGCALVIQPSAPLNCPSLEKNISKLESIYQLGYRHGLESIDKVKAFLEK